MSSGESLATCDPSETGFFSFTDFSFSDFFSFLDFLEVRPSESLRENLEWDAGIAPPDRWDAQFVSLDRISS